MILDYYVGDVLPPIIPCTPLHLSDVNPERIIDYCKFRVPEFISDYSETGKAKSLLLLANDALSTHFHLHLTECSHQILFFWCFTECMSLRLRRENTFPMQRSIG